MAVQHDGLLVKKRTTPSVDIKGSVEGNKDNEYYITFL